MTKTRSTKRALLLSALSLLLCVSMLVGSTFAWFTDSVTSNKNQIIAGNLDVELEYKKVVDGKLTAEWETVQGKSDLFDPNALWEPGHAEVVYLKVSNLGSLALKYQLGVNFKETPGTNAKGDSFLLSDYLVFKTLLIEENDVGEYTREWITNEYDDTDMGLKDYNGTTTALNPEGKTIVENVDHEDYVALIIYMPETVGNVANYKTSDDPSAPNKYAPKIELGINLFATQKDAETDSFGPDYDKDSAVDTIDEAEALMAAGKDVTLAGCYEPNGILVIPEDYTGTLTLANSTLKSVQGLKDANIVIQGNVIVNAQYDGPATFAATSKPFDGSAITAKGALKISGTGHLTAIAADVNDAVGIGGKVSTTIENITIDKVTGSFVQQNFIKDVDYGKSEPEGGAAIGGAKINLTGVTIVEALGGSKAAGIGARFWNSVVINIENCIINKVVGGNASAGIGGSRVSSDATINQNVSITIKDSLVTAFGGQFAAGIGAGYDTHCAESLTTLPDCNIVITGNSVINATGGKYGAGIGTGYHTAGLSGSIAGTVEVNAVGGGNREKYTAAMAVGFGVIDMDNPNREGAKASASRFDYKGTIITVKDAPVVAANSDKLDAAIAAGKTNIALGSGEYIIPNSAQGKTLTIVGNGQTKIVTNTSGSYEGCNYALDGSTVVFENVNITTDGQSFTGYARCNATYKNCVINNTYFLYGKSLFENCTFNVSGNAYNIWTYGSGNAEFNDCTFNCDGKAIYMDGNGATGTKLTVNSCTFNDNGDDTVTGKAAIETGTTYGQTYELIVNNTKVNGFVVNPDGLSTGSTLWGNKHSMGTDKLNVVIDGVDVY